MNYKLIILVTTLSIAILTLYYISFVKTGETLEANEIVPGQEFGDIVKGENKADYIKNKIKEEINSTVDEEDLVTGLKKIEEQINNIVLEKLKNNEQLFINVGAPPTKIFDENVFDNDLEPYYQQKSSKQLRLQPHQEAESKLDYGQINRLETCWRNKKNNSKFRGIGAPANRNIDYGKGIPGFHNGDNNDKVLIVNKNGELSTINLGKLNDKIKNTYKYIMTAIQKEKERRFCGDVIDVMTHLQNEYFSKNENFSGALPDYNQNNWDVDAEKKREVFNELQELNLADCGRDGNTVTYMYNMFGLRYLGCRHGANPTDAPCWPNCRDPGEDNENYIYPFFTDNANNLNIILSNEGNFYEPDNKANQNLSELITNIHYYINSEVLRRNVSDEIIIRKYNKNLNKKNLNNNELISIF